MLLEQELCPKSLFYLPALFPNPFPVPIKDHRLGSSRVGTSLIIDMNGEEFMVKVKCVDRLSGCMQICIALLEGLQGRVECLGPIRSALHRCSVH